MEINDLIENAITNAVIRRGSLEEALSELSDNESANIAGGMGSKTIVTGKFPIKPICPPEKPPIKLICPPIINGMIYVPDDKLSMA